MRIFSYFTPLIIYFPTTFRFNGNRTQFSTQREKKSEDKIAIDLGHVNNAMEKLK